MAISSSSFSALCLVTSAFFAAGRSRAEDVVVIVGSRSGPGDNYPDLALVIWPDHHEPVLVRSKRDPPIGNHLFNFVHCDAMLLNVIAIPLIPYQRADNVRRHWRHPSTLWERLSDNRRSRMRPCSSRWDLIFERERYEW